MFYELMIRNNISLDISWFAVSIDYNNKHRISLQQNTDRKQYNNNNSKNEKKKCKKVNLL